MVFREDEEDLTACELNELALRMASGMPGAEGADEDGMELLEVVFGCEGDGAMRRA